MANNLRLINTTLAIFNPGNSGQLDLSKYVQVGDDGYIDPSLIPPSAVVTVYEVFSEAEMLALQCQPSDIAIRRDNPSYSITYILYGPNPALLSNWRRITALQAEDTGKAKVSDTDALLDFLQYKLVAGSNITLEVVETNGREVIKINSDAPPVSPAVIITTIPDQTPKHEEAFSLNLNAYVSTIGTSISTPSYTWAVTVGTLPTGLSLVGAVISGTATVAEQTANITVRATDTANGNIQATKTIDFAVSAAITVPPILGSIPTQEPAHNTDYELDLNDYVTLTDGDPILGYALVSGILPTGLSLSTTTGIISGKATVGSQATQAFFRVSDKDGVSNSIGVIFNVGEALGLPPIFNPVPLQSMDVDKLYSINLANYAQTLDDDPITSYLLISGTLPRGLSLNTNNGFITGTPDYPGQKTKATFVVLDKDGASNSQEISFAVLDEPITPPGTPTTYDIYLIYNKYQSVNLLTYDPYKRYFGCGHWQHTFYRWYWYRWFNYYFTQLSYVSGTIPTGMALDFTNGVNIPNAMKVTFNLYGTPTVAGQDTTLVVKVNEYAYKSHSYWYYHWWWFSYYGVWHSKASYYAPTVRTPGLELTFRIHVTEAPISQAPVINTIPIQTLVHQTNYNLNLNTYITLGDGGAIVQYWVESGSLPDGVTLNTTTGVISGLPIYYGPNQSRYLAAIQVSDAESISNAVIVEFRVTPTA